MAIAVALSCGGAVAQETKDGANSLEEIVVTGTSSSTRTKLESSVAITTMDAEALAREDAFSTADILEVVPGLWVEDSGGEISNNVAPRGLGGGAAFRFISIQEDGLPVSYDNDHVDTQQRQDITISRMEAIRGGTAGILTTNGPGSIVNFITRKGTEDPEGSLRFTVSDYGTRRTDLFYGAPVDDDGKWLLGIGGYYRTSDGIRDVGFTADRGGQLRASLTRKLDDGELTFTVKNINDHNTFYLPIPVNNPDSDPSSIPGIDASSGTLLGIGTSRITHRTPEGVGQTNMEDGYHTKLNSFGVNFRKEIDSNWSLDIAARQTTWHLNANGIFPWGLQDGAERLQEADVQAAVAAFGGASAAYRYTDSGVLVSDINNLNGNGLTTLGVAIDRDRRTEEFMSNIRLNHETDNNSLAFGVLFADKVLNGYNTKSSFILSDVKHNADLLDIVILDAAGEEVGTYTDNGVYSYGIWLDDATGDVKSTSLYINDEFQVNDKLRIDAGTRYEVAEFNASTGNTARQTLEGGNDNVWVNDTANWFDGSYSHRSREYKEWSFTAGANYKITDRFAVYGRWASSYQTTGVGSYGGLVEPVADLTFSEFGTRYFGDNVTVSLVLFNTVFENLGFGARNQATGLTEQITIETDTTGVEFEGEWNVADAFTIAFSGVFQDSEVLGIPAGDVNEAFNGNMVQRTPDTQVRLINTFHSPVGDFFLTAHYLSKRFADLGNTVELDAYHTLDLGWRYQVNDAITVQVKGTNLNNAIGLTEGNPRAGFVEGDDGVGGFFYARPINGRAFQATFQYDF
ncbi:TonB-dependent siderophore receptor [Woeseia oceani]|uniref:TonB-dependent siderophore receptor n=1 Tax=Woeseia oceani TaxID=1548547 RepID=UPI0018D3E053|nr:TonB-dependent receptor [Woeseia oceani]